MFEAPYTAYDPTDKSGFSYETVVKRWPVILTQIIDHLNRTNHELTLQINHEDEINVRQKIEEGKTIIQKIGTLKYKMGRDHAIEAIPDDGEAHVESYNAELANLARSSKNTWFTAPWLFAECYLYRLVRSYFSLTRHWSRYDPFCAQKLDAFKKSGKAIYQIATTMLELENSELLEPEKLKMMFKEIMQISLWGNAIDLSLLTQLSLSDVESLQSVGKDHQESKKKYILRDDSDEAWQAITSLKADRVDFVLDNAGFELFTDLVFADFLVTYTPFVSRAIFHPKLIPWFVSDVTPPDFASILTNLVETSFNIPNPAEYSSGCLEHLIARWGKYIEAGIFSLSVSINTPVGGTCSEETNSTNFWTTPWPYWDMKIRAEELWTWLNQSGLVIFKGDLNYRKLTGDVQWPASTPFQSAIGPLAGSFSLLSLRTCKADVVVGIDQDMADHLDQSGEKWRVNGRYALVSFLPASQGRND